MSLRLEARGGSCVVADRRIEKTIIADIVYFDLETQRTANDAGGWDKKAAMGMTVGATYSSGTGKHAVYGE